MTKGHRKLKYYYNTLDKKKTLQRMQSIHPGISTKGIEKSLSKLSLKLIFIPSQETSVLDCISLIGFVSQFLRRIEKLSKMLYSIYSVIGEQGATGRGHISQCFKGMTQSKSDIQNFAYFFVLY